MYVMRFERKNRSSLYVYIQASPRIFGILADWMSQAPHYDSTGLVYYYVSPNCMQTLISVCNRPDHMFDITREALVKFF